MAGFKVLSGDVNWSDYGGSWYRKVGDRYHVMVLTNMHEATGEEDQEKYIVELREVDPRSNALAQAVLSCGCEDILPGDAGYGLMCVDALSSYGAYAPLGQWSGNNFSLMMRATRALSRALEEDPAEYEAAMDRPVNRIGSTAREYQAGDIRSAVLRGVAEGRTDAEIMLKIGVW